MPKPKKKLALNYLLVLVCLCLGSFSWALHADEDAIEEQIEQYREETQKLQERIQKGEFINPANFPIDEILHEYRKLSPKDTKEHLGQIFKDKPLVDNTKFVEYIDTVMRDSQAMKDLWQITQNKTKLLIFIACNILLFIIGFWLKKRRARRKSNSGLIQRFVMWWVRLAFSISLRIALVVLFFGQELYRIARITQQFFF